MRTVIPLISREEMAQWKDVSPFSNWEYMERHIRNAQEAYVRPLLGKVLYDEIQQTYPSPVQAETLKEDFVKEWLVFLAYAEYVKYSGVYDTNTGLQGFRHDYSEPIELKRLELLRKDADIDAENRKAEVLRYLRENAQALNWKDPEKCGENSTEQPTNIGISAIRPPRPDETNFFIK